MGGNVLFIASLNDLDDVSFKLDHLWHFLRRILIFINALHSEVGVFQILGKGLANLAECLLHLINFEAQHIPSAKLTRFYHEGCSKL